jgi:Mor family transcriptional regulator
VGVSTVTEDIDPARELLNELVRAVCEATGLRAVSAVRFVEPIVRHLQQNYGGEQLYIPSVGRTYPVDEMRQAVLSGVSMRALCRKYKVSRRTLYRLLDGKPA